MLIPNEGFRLGVFVRQTVTGIETEIGTVTEIVTVTAADKAIA